MSTTYKVATDDRISSGTTYTQSKDDDIETKRRSVTVKGLAGLQNLGNTCYMNAVLQCIASTDLLVSYLVNRHFKDELRTGIIHQISEEKRRMLNLPKGADVSIKLGTIRKRFKHSITYNLYKILTMMWRINCIIKPKTFKEIIGNMNPTFKGGQQNDSQEILNFILDCIHEETKTDVKIEIKKLEQDVEGYSAIRSNFVRDLANSVIPVEDKIRISEEYNKYRKAHQREDAICSSLLFWRNHLQGNHSVIIDIFTGLFLTEIECTVCKNKVFTFEPFNILPLSIIEKVKECTLDDCLKHFGVTELLCGQNQYSCDICNAKTDAAKRTMIWHIPDRLIIQLKRFTNTYASTSKNGTYVDFPINDLNLKDYTSPYNIRDNVYDLYGVVHHSGYLYGGHYIAYTKSPINNEWYEFNDDDALHIDKDKVKDEVVDDGGYILFYQKRQPSMFDSEEDNDSEMS